MLQYKSGDGVVLPADRGLSFILDEGVRLAADRPVLSWKNAAGWQDVSYRRFADHVRAVAKILLSHGAAHGDRVAVLGRTSYEWAVVDFAVLSIGAVTVPIYPTASEQQIRHLLVDSAASWCFAETDDQRIQLDRIGGSALRAGAWLLETVGAWREADQDGPEDAEFDDRRAKVRADDLATIVYTSGTTGTPKGCMLTHRNLYASSANTVEHTGQLFRSAAGEQATTLLGLPLSHVFGRTILIACLYGGTRTGLVAGVPELIAELPVFRPTFLALVPYALEKIRKRVREPAAGGVGVVDAEAERIAIEFGLASARGLRIDTDLHDAHAAFDEKVYSRVRASFGGRFQHAICGGASLDDSTAAFYGGVGVQILNCYGLTEAATAVTVNVPATNRMGSTGRPIPGTTVAIADDDELLIRGLNVSPGYWQGSPQPTDRDATQAGEGPWLHTGDLGRLDDEGFLYITGRRKEILVTSGGKNVAPTPLEDRVRLHPLVSNCMVVGDARPFVSALVTIDPVALSGWKASRGAEGEDDSWRHNPDLLAEIQTAIDDANSLVSRAESIRAFRVLATDFTVDGGQLTPSMKLRRNVIEADFAADIAAVYG
ncbi:AMP-dependent synthetase/ligase [Protofrankia symbiont of Coriaria ruscifolia]|uniref:AMP-dependent synthetase/ligase n=1 Tax=Protofrankia symbiont of Coriaria ruscifolia TaxID=1306542 RepID=UPI001040FA42|nr:AMP-dependent synthetase/ligase [Protofrankia symbiont of Coriaria ruscifolia]